MKKPLLITTTLVVLALSATSIYAQVTTGTSIVDKMKAAAHSFTLSSVLNPTDTGLQSSPIKGKKTGDILTAGEWNRVLELLGESGINGPELWKCTCGGYINMVTTQNLTAGETCVFGNGGTASNVQYASWSCTKLPNTGGSVSSGWVDVPLTGIENFDDSCMYRYQINYSSGGREPYVPKETYYYVNGVSSTQLVWWLENDSQMSTYHISASSKDKLRINGTPYTTGGVSVTKIEKLCGGGGGSSVNSDDYSRAKAIRASGFTLNIPSGITDWPDTIVCDGFGGWAGGRQILTLDFTGNNVVGYTQTEGVGVYFNPSTGVLAQADRVGSCGASNIATICAAGRCIK